MKRIVFRVEKLLGIAATRHRRPQGITRVSDLVLARIGIVDARHARRRAADERAEQERLRECKLHQVMFRFVPASAPAPAPAPVAAPAPAPVLAPVPAPAQQLQITIMELHL